MEDTVLSHASYDLHLHTCWSYDAVAEVASYFERASELGMRCITITDHHVLDSLPEMLDAAQAHPGIVTVPSAELTVTTSIGPVDLLCYGFPLDIPEALIQILERYHEWQRQTGKAICRGMQALGYPFDDADRLELLEKYRPPRTLKVQGATHVRNGVLRAHFVSQGFIQDESEYSDLLSRLRQAVPFPPYPQVDQVVPAVKEVGALVAIAHPHAYFAKGDPQRMEQLRRECQLDGAECAHPNVPPEFTPRYREYCVEHGLFSTGGSDCHTEQDIGSRFAAHGGPEEWMDEFLERVGDRAIPPADPADRAAAELGYRPATREPDGRAPGQ